MGYLNSPSSFGYPVPKDAGEFEGVQQRPATQVGTRSTWPVSRGRGAGARSAWREGGFRGTSQQPPMPVGRLPGSRARLVAEGEAGE